MRNRRDKEIVDRLSYLIEVATRGDPEVRSDFRQMVVKSQVPKRLEVPDQKKVVGLLYEAGIPQAEVVKTDLKRAYSGRLLKYFVSARELAEKFRRERFIRPPKEHPEIETGFRKVDVSEALKEVDRWADESVDTDPYKWHGHACPRERRAFYSSDQWSRRAKAIRAMDCFTCQRCGAGDKELHAHHEAPIFSVFSKKFKRNFDVTRITTWCTDCHRSFHENADRTWWGFALRPDGHSDDLHERDKERRRKHDAAQECLWCKRFVW